MIVKIVKRFCDKETGEIREAGSIAEITTDRYHEICAAGNFVIEVKTKAVPPTKARKTAAKTKR